MVGMQHGRRGFLRFLRSLLFFFPSLVRYRFSLVSAFTMSALLGACGSAIPRTELDRCRLGVADGNDAFAVRQGAACAMVAQRLSRDEKPRDAMGYARKACDLEDARGCQEYLALVRSQPALPPDELSKARSVGEKACAGMVIGLDGTDARPGLCARTAELYLDRDPRSPGDAGRLFARACTLGETASCAQAESLGFEPEEPRAIAPKASPKGGPPPALPRPAASATSAAPPPPCHEMRPCVALEVSQRNATEVVGTLVNRCDRAVACTWCPSRGDEVRRADCRTATLAPSESRQGREQGLWFEGYNAIAYDCMDASDDKRCLAF